MAWGSVIGSVVGGALSAGGAMSAGQASAQAAKRAYKHRYQWTVGDLRKAGLNPMLAISQGAPVPNSPQMPNVGEAAVSGAAKGSAAVTAAKMAKEQIINIGFDTNLKNEQAGAAQATAESARASARLNNAEAALKEAKAPYSAKNAEVESLSLDRQFQILGRDLEIKGWQSGMGRMELRQLPEVQKLEIEYKRLMNEALSLGMSEKDADAKFWENVPEMKYGKEIIPFLKMIFR